MKRLSVILILICAIVLAPEPAPAAPPDPAEQFDFADGLFIRKMYDMAAAEYEKYFTQFPDAQDASRAYFMFAESFFRMGDHSKAVEKYVDFINRFPEEKDVPLARLHMGISYIELKDYTRACDMLRSLPDKKYPDIQPDIYYFLGLSEIAGGNKEAGVKHLESAIELNGDSVYPPLAAYQRALIYLNDADIEKAVSLFDRCIQMTKDQELRISALFGRAQAELEGRQYEKAEKDFRGLLENAESPDEIRQGSLVNLLQALYSSGRYEDVTKTYHEKAGIIKGPVFQFNCARITAKAYSMLKEYERALSFLDQMPGETGISDENRMAAVLDKITVLMLQEKFKEAKELIKANVSYAETPQFIFLMAEACFYLNEFGKAQEYYGKVMELAGDRPLYKDALYGMAHACLRAGEKEKALGVFARFTTDYADDARSPEALYSAIILDDELKRIDEGIARCGLFLERYQDHPKRENIYFLKGDLYTKKKEYLLAIRLYEEFKKGYTDSKRIREADFLIGYNYQSLGETKRSNEYYAMVKKDTADKGLYYNAQKNMAQNYLTQGKETEAAQALERIIMAYPENDLGIDAYFWVAKKCTEKKRYTDAVLVLERARENKEKENRILEYSYLLAEAYRGAGNYAGAIGEYKECIKDNTADERFKGPAFLGLGRVSESQNDLSRAQGYYEQAISFNPEDNTVTMRARFYLADILYRKKEYGDAARIFMMVTILYSDNKFVPEALYKAAEAFRHAGKLSEARKAFSDFIKRYPRHQYLPSAKQNLESIGNEKT